MLSLALAETLTVPLTVAFDAGAVKEAVGGVVSGTGDGAPPISRTPAASATAIVPELIVTRVPDCDKSYRAPGTRPVTTWRTTPAGTPYVMPFAEVGPAVTGKSTAVVPPTMAPSNAAPLRVWINEGAPGSAPSVV